ncbi:putative helicase [Gordonia hirsuta DSM 44140 = NBRC 16056]|uniref:Putative helicase n=1 Tax=Gordonia hirsuta DSM 44140 = NBRC 16056 TaxID=1121927 RepID=L7L4W6_9ACTN|nr:DEAD/DEAH box helicase [Gordonia hirsuta]GAC56190.1 putative helicase [Gordonia hirsuta DSM 44140 = NBRC 16056]
MPDRPVLGLRALWRPGLGLALWPDTPGPDTPGPAATSPVSPARAAGTPTAASPPPLEDLIDLPASVADLLARRKPRHTVDQRGPDGVRTLRSAVVIGVPTAVELLDRCEHLSVGGDLAFYRYLLSGARALRDAGAVAPGVQVTAEEAVVTWSALPTPAWRSWETVIAASAPPALVADGVPALLDFVAQILDAECRRILAPEYGRSQIPLIDALAAPAALPLPDHAGAAASAWRSWCQTGPQSGPSLVLRLHEPEDTGDTRSDPVSAEAQLPAEAQLWRLQVCRRQDEISENPALPARLTEVVPHRLSAHDLDELTSELAVALQAYGELSRAQTDPHNLDFLLTTEQVADFFAEGAALIGQAGIPVLLPRTIAEVTPEVTLRAAPVPGGQSRPGLVGLDEISDFQWRLALGDGSAPLSQDDLNELARQHGDLVRIRGRWVRAEGAALTRAAAFLTTRAATDDGAAVDLAELMALIGGTDDRLPVPVTGVQGLDWLDDIATGGALRPEPVAVPGTLRATLRPYQQRGLDWLGALASIGAGGVLADDMGLGKTVQVIALIARRRADTAQAPPALVVCPMSVIGNWQHELARFTPDLRVVVHHGPHRQAALLSDAATDVVVTTFATLTRDREHFAAASWDLLVVDEAQHVKNVRTAAAKALRSLPVRRRIALTGTPVENRLEDLRAVIDLVNPGLLGTASSFRARFAEPIERDRDPAALARLNALTRPFILRRLKTDPAIAPDLPEKSELTVRTNLTAEQAGLYQAVLNELHEALADAQHHGQRRKTVLAALTRLKQICNHPAHYLGDGSPMLRRGRHRSGKFELLSDITTTLVDEGDRALIFTQFAAFADLLSRWLSPLVDRPVPVLHGGLPRTQRDALVSGFGADDGPPILVATLKAGGTGLNLVAANQVIHADRWWNPAVEEQATDRAYRIGQTRAVQVRRFVCVGTLEERIDELIAAKRELSSLTVATGESWLADLGDDALLDLLSLRDAAVGE